jgi:hypothetical protein
LRVSIGSSLQPIDLIRACPAGAQRTLSGRTLHAQRLPRHLTQEASPANHDLCSPCRCPADTLQALTTRLTGCTPASSSPSTPSTLSTAISIPSHPIHVANHTAYHLCHPHRQLCRQIPRSTLASSVPFPVTSMPSITLSTSRHPHRQSWQVSSRSRAPIFSPPHLLYPRGPVSFLTSLAFWRLGALVPSYLYALVSNTVS